MLGAPHDAVKLLQSSSIFPPRQVPAVAVLCTLETPLPLIYLYKEPILCFSKQEIFGVHSKCCENQGEECGEMREGEERCCHRCYLRFRSDFLCYNNAGSCSRPASGQPHHRFGLPEFTSGRSQRLQGISTSHRREIPHFSFLEQWIRVPFPLASHLQTPRSR